MGGWVRPARRARALGLRHSPDGEREAVRREHPCHAEGAATIQLRRFESDPEGYSPVGVRRKDPVFLTPVLGLSFLEHSRDVDKNAEEWVHQQKIHLLRDREHPERWCWEAALQGVDLRRADLDRDILPKLHGVKSHAHRIAVLKRLYSWLVSRCALPCCAGRRPVLEPTEDPTFRRLRAPKRMPREVEPFTAGAFQAVLGRLAEP